MQIIISGRHFTVADEMKKHIIDKLSDILDSKSLKVSTVRVVLELEKTRNKVEIVVNLKHNDIETIVEGYDMQEAVDAAINKIDVQVRRFLDKVQDHHGKKKIELAADGDDSGEE
ncbi:MAG: ribosome-associated translation inhibitor RaiA [Victivallaceae bacterium]